MRVYAELLQMVDVGYAAVFSGHLLNGISV
jgi:hypothetical protein